MKFLDYITNIETLSLTLIEGDGDCIFQLQMDSFGISGDGQGNVDFPNLQVDATGEQAIYGFQNFPLFEILAQNANGAAAEFPAFEVNGTIGEPILGNAQFPILEVEAQGRLGNGGEYYFYVQVEGEGNANREYELCD